MVFIFLHLTRSQEPLKVPDSLKKRVCKEEGAEERGREREREGERGREREREGEGGKGRERGRRREKEGGRRKGREGEEERGREREREGVGGRGRGGGREGEGGRGRGQQKRNFLIIFHTFLARGRSSRSPRSHIRPPPPSVLPPPVLLLRGPPDFLVVFYFFEFFAGLGNFGSGAPSVPGPPRGSSCGLIVLGNTGTLFPPTIFFGYSKLCILFSSEHEFN
jgi:hypothetical protein